MKTLLAILALVTGLGTPARALEPTPLQTFAACAGRLSAVMEHQWMFDGSASEVTEIRRAQVLDLLAAVMEPDQGRTVLHWRLAAKQAQSVLLTRATFNDDPSDAAWAQQQAIQYERACTSFLLS